MLAARIITRLNLLTLTRSVNVWYSWDSEDNGPIFNKITNTKTFADFLRVYNDNPRECNGDVIGSASKHISGLISLKDRIQYKQVGEIVKSITESDLSTISDKSMIGILSILRSLKTKNIMSPAISNLKNALFSKYIVSLQGKQPSEMDINMLVNVYYEAAFFKNVNQCRMIAEKILKMLVGDGKVNLPYNQVTFLMHALSIRQDLSFFEIKMRRILMKQVQTLLPTLKPNELVKFAIKVNKLDSFDFNSEEFFIAKQIANKILQNIDQLEERSVYELLKGEFSSKYHGFYKIYEQICKNVFEEIDQHGNTNFGADPIFKILSLISDKMNIDKIPILSQKKLFKFLERYAEQCIIGQKQLKDFTHHIYDMVKNNFFNGENKERLVKIIKRNLLPLNASTLYEMALNEYNISSFAEVVLRFKVEDIKGEEFFVRLGIIASRIIETGNTDPQVVEYLGRIQGKIAEMVSTPQKFVEFMKKMLRSNQLNPLDFHHFFGRSIEVLPNPLSQQLSNPTYRYYYLLYHQQATSQREFNHFLINHEPSILLEQFLHLLSYHIHKQFKLSDYKRPLILTIHRRLPQILDTKNKRNIEIVIQFLIRYNKAVVYGYLDANSEISIFRIITIMINNIDLLISTENSSHFYNMLEKYLTRNFRRYNLEQNYKNLLKHLVGNIDKMALARKGTLRIIVEEGLRLNLLTKKSLQNIQLQKLYLPFYNKSRIALIKNQNDTVTIEGVNYRALEIAFSNQNYEKYVSDNQSAILTIIKQASFRQLAHYLTFYNLHKTPTGNKILREILNHLVEKITTFEGIDINGILANALDKGFYTIVQFKGLAEKAIEDFRRKMSSYSIESHMELISFIISQPSLNPREYYNQLAEYAQKSEVIKGHTYEQLIIRLASTNYAFKEHQIKVIHSLLSSNIHASLYLFLMIENLISDASIRSNYVKQYIERHTELFEKLKDGVSLSINKAYYLYLKKVYPEETANWTIDDAHLYSQKFTIKNNNIQLLSLIQQLSGAKYEEFTELAPQNQFYKIKNCIFTFFYPKKLGAYYQHDFVKRLARAVKGKEVTPICINLNISNYSIIEYINKECPTLFDQEAYGRALQQKKEAYLTKKDKKGEIQGERVE